MSLFKHVITGPVCGLSTDINEVLCAKSLSHKAILPAQFLTVSVHFQNEPFRSLVTFMETTQHPEQVAGHRVMRWNSMSG